MGGLTFIAIPTIEGVGLQLIPPDTLKLKGTMTKKDPSASVGKFFEKLHQEAVASRLSAFCVDVTQLTFVNSSSIRLFIDWAVWVKGERTHRYTLKFKTSRLITWQGTAFSALTSLMSDVVTVERI
jgi:hypothetical protein